MFFLPCVSHDQKSFKTILFCVRKIMSFQTREIFRDPPSWYFLVLPRKIRNLAQNQRKPYFSVRGKSRIFRPGGFPGIPPREFRGVAGHPWLGGWPPPPQGGGVKGPGFRGRNFWQKWSKIKNSGPQILSAATGFVILILEVKNRQKMGVFSKSRVLFLLVKINSLLLETAVKKAEILEFLMWKFVKNCE